MMHNIIIKALLETVKLERGQIGPLVPKRVI